MDTFSFQVQIRALTTDNVRFEVDGETVRVYRDAADIEDITELTSDRIEMLRQDLAIDPAMDLLTAVKQLVDDGRGRDVLDVARKRGKLVFGQTYFD